MNVVSTKNSNDESNLENDPKMGSNYQNNKVSSCPDIIEILQMLGEPLILNKFIERGETDKGRAAARVDWGIIKGGSYHVRDIMMPLCPFLRSPL